MSHVESLYEPSTSSSSNRQIKKIRTENGNHASITNGKKENRVKELAEDMVEYVFEMALLEEVFNEHRDASIMHRCGGVHYPDSSSSNSHSPSKQYEVVCPECQRTIAASRFAPHLDKCIGMGRNSSRVARQKMQQGHEGGSSNSHSEEEVMISNEDDDDDWSSKRKRSSKRNRGKKKPKRDNDS